LLKYLSNEDFRNNYQNYRILFVDYKYRGYYSNSDIKKLKNPDHKNIITHVVLETPIYSEYVDLEVDKVKISFLDSQEYLNSYQINKQCTLNTIINGQIYQVASKKSVIDTGSQISHLICNDSWDFKNKKFIESNQFFKYLNTIKDKTETMSFKGISGEIVKPVVCFITPLYIGIDDLYIPISNFSISNYKNNTIDECFLVSMDAISQCNYVSFIEDKRYKIHLSICDKEDNNYYVMTLSNGLILVNDDIYNDNIYYHVSEVDINNINSIRKFKTLKNLSLIVIDFMEIDFNYIYQNDIINTKDETVSRLLELYDGIYFKTSDKNLMILKENFPLVRVNIQSTQNNIKTFQIGAGYISLNI